jgi:CelD/BcsL family acetyltransferase involved in cellulose biosynthesis
MAYRRYFGVGKTFHRLRVAEQGNAAQGAAFLMTRGHTARRLEWWGAGIHDIGDVCCACPQAAQALWQKIEHLATQHDATHLAQIDARSPLIELAVGAGWHVNPAEACPVLQLPDAWPDYVASLGKNMREQIKRYPKRLEKQFSVQYEMAQSEDEVQRALTDLFALHGKRWRARGQTGVLALPRRQKFHRAVCSAFLKRGWLRLWTLRCDGRPACVLLNYFYAGRYYFFIGGFEPELMRWSVGTCLFARVFQLAIEEGASEFDFLRGEEEYKYRFGAINRDYKTLAMFQPSTRGRLLQKRIRLEEAVTHRIHQSFSAAHRGKERDTAS